MIVNQNMAASHVPFLRLLAKEPAMPMRGPRAPWPAGPTYRWHSKVVASFRFAAWEQNRLNDVDRCAPAPGQVVFTIPGSFTRI